MSNTLHGDPDVVPQMLAPPVTTRDTFELLTLYDPARGIDGLLDQIDLREVTSRRVYWSVLGRAPELRHAGPQPDSYDPRAHMRAALTGEEFQNRLVTALLQAYPEKKRLLLIHIPKCAGSDLTVHLLARHPGLNQRLGERGWVEPPALFDRLRELLLRLRISPTVFLHGHVPLRTIVTRQLARANDDLFTVMREPVSRAISQVNYILTRFMNDPELRAVDTRDWLRFLDEGRVRAAIAGGPTRELALEILRTPQLVQRNTACHALGVGDCRSALEHCVLSNIEITATGQYRDWLRARFGFVAETRINASRQLLQRGDLGQAELDYLAAHDAEDHMLYRIVEEELARGGALSLRGEALHPRLG